MSKILIIGGGVSGLSAGIYARLHGHEAIICERHSVPGGNLTGWQRDGYHIDNCVHWLTGTNPANELYSVWEDLGVLGGENRIFRGNSLYTCEYEGQTLSLCRDLNELRDNMLRISPEDKKEINSLIRTVEIIQRLMHIAGENKDEGIGKGALVAEIPRLLKYLGLTNGELAERFKHPLIKQFLVSFLTDKFGSLALLFVFANFCGDNADLPVGGSTAMAQNLTQRLTSLGGELLLRKEAKKINVENGKATSVSFTDGTSIETDYVVIAADPATVFPAMIDAKMPKELVKFYKSDSMMRFSSYQCAFACDQSELPFEGDFSFELPEKYKRKLLADHLVVREFSHEKDYAPDGKQLIQTMTFCDEETSKRFIKLRENKKVYANLKRHLSGLVKSAITEKFPELKEKLKCIDIWTPATYKRYVGSDIGSYMSFAFSHGVIPKKIKSGIKGLQNVFMATQWQMSPGGLPIAATSGKKAIEAILQAEKNKRPKPISAR